MIKPSHGTESFGEEPKQQETCPPKDPSLLADVAIQQGLPRSAETLDYTPYVFLQSLRAHIQADPAASRAFGRSSSLIPARDQLLHIHESLHSPQEPKVITRTDVRRLSFNVWRLYPLIGDTPQPTYSFLRELYLLYKEDAQAFKKRGVPDPGILAMYHSPDIINEIDQQYGSHEFIDKAAILNAFKLNRVNPKQMLDDLITKMKDFKDVAEPALRSEYGYAGDWGAWFVRELIVNQQGEKSARKIFSIMQQIQQRYPDTPLEQLERLATRAIGYRGQRQKLAQAAITELLADTPQFTYSSPNLAIAKEQLMLIRKAQIEGMLKKPGKNYTYQEGMGLARTARANWHETFEAIDIEKECGYLHSMATQYNGLATTQEAHSKINLDPQNLCHMLVVFAEDVTEFRLKGMSDPARAARFYASSAFDHFREKFNIPENALRYLFSHSASRGSGLEKSVLRLVELEKQYGSSLSQSVLYKWACRTDALARIPEIMGFLEKAKTLYPWATKADILRAGKQEKFKDVLAQWDANIKEIDRLYPKNKDLPKYRRKMLASMEGDVSTNVRDYFSRVAKIKKTYSKSPFVSRYYMLTWAESKEKYLQMAKNHEIRVKEITSLLNDEGLDHMDHKVLGNLAFSHTSLTADERVEKFLANREALEIFRQDHHLGEHMEQWMVDSVSTKNTSLKYLRIQLKTLAYLKKSGAFDKSNFKALEPPDPEHTQKDDTYELAESALSRLAPLDQQAVMLIFGFAHDIDKASLEEELDVPDLEKYVMEEVVPHLATLRN